MATTLAQVLGKVRRRLGTGENDPEFPVATLTDYVNDAIAELWSDCARLAPDVLLVIDRSVTRSAGTDRVVFAAQSPPIGAVEQIRRLRSNGQPLTCTLYEQLETANQYAITGSSSATVIVTRSADPLVMDYTPAPPRIAQGNDTLPDFIPDGYMAVVEYMVVREAMPQGGESAMPADYRDRYEERRDSLWEHWRQRSPDMQLRRK
jgi:hypothetical protein